MRRSVHCMIIYPAYAQLTRCFSAVAELLVYHRQNDHIASTMRDDIHWLRVKQRMMFKLVQW